jgi:hypothetical protein
MTVPPETTAAAERIPVWLFLLRLLWVAVELVLVYLLAQGGDLFFYQKF